MNLDNYTPTALTKVVKRLKPKDRGLLGLVFGKIAEHNTPYISTDIDDSVPEVAPLVSPIEEGVVLKDQGSITKTMEAAFSRVKKPVDFTKAITRIPGQAIDSEQDNTLYHMTRNITSCKESIETRQKVMAAQALYEGKITYNGTNGKSFEADFGRSTDLSLVLSGEAAWTTATAKVNDQLEDAAQAISDACGSTANTLILGSNAWKLFRKLDEVKEKLDTRRGSNSELETAASANAGLSYKGTFGNFDVIVYTEKYKDASGNMQPILDPNAAIVLNIADVSGILHFGAVMGENGLVKTDYLAKKDFKIETSQTWNIVESSYLPIPHQINATYALTVA